MASEDLPRNDPRATQWLLALIHAYRKQARNTSKTVLRQVHLSQRFGRRTQIAHIWIETYPPLDHHFLLVTHFDDLPDQQVLSWGPIEPRLLTRVLEDFDQNEWYHRPLPRERRGPVWSVRNPTEHGLLSDRVDWQLRGLHDAIRFQLFNPRDREDSELYLSGIDANIGAGTFHGDLLSRTPESIIGYFFREAAANIRRKKEYLRERKANPVAGNSHPEPPPNGYSCVLFPARHVGKNPAKSISERLWGMYIVGPGTIVLNRDYGAFRAFATYDGVIGVLERDEKSARNFLNMTCLALRKAGEPTAFLRPRDLGPFTVREEKVDPLEFRSWSFNPEDRPTANRTERMAFDGNMISIRKLDTAFRRATRLVKDSDLDANLALLEAETQLEEDRFRQAFFLSWIVVEKRLAEVWELLLVRATGHGSETGESAEWQPTLIARGLERAGLMSPGLSAKLREFNKRRNKILHGREATKGDATGMLDAARNTVTELRNAQKNLERRIRR